MAPPVGAAGTPAAPRVVNAPATAAASGVAPAAQRSRGPRPPPPTPSSSSDEEGDSGWRGRWGEAARLGGMRAQEATPHGSAVAMATSDREPGRPDTVPPPRLPFPAATVSATAAQMRDALRAAARSGPNGDETPSRASAASPPAAAGRAPRRRRRGVAPLTCATPGGDRKGASRAGPAPPSSLTTSCPWPSQCPPRRRTPTKTTSSSVLLPSTTAERGRPPRRLPGALSPPAVSAPDATDSLLPRTNSRGEGGRSESEDGVAETLATAVRRSRCSGRRRRRRDGDGESEPPPGTGVSPPDDEQLAPPRERAEDDE